MSGERNSTDTFALLLSVDFKFLNITEKNTKYILQTL
jgi:hypothetical protein